MEEAKKHVERYKAKQKQNIEQTNIAYLLEQGESKRPLPEEPSYDSDEDPYNSESDSEDWQEVEQAEVSQPRVIPKQGVQITVEMPGVMRKKKGVDLMASIKRRMNRVKKENQVLVHKVHLLSWIAHGNYVNRVLGDRELMGIGLLLLPSNQAFPSGEYQ